MAADSKATVRISGAVKTHDTVNKLFTVSKYHPVGVMIYGNAELMGIPWETTIKVYRDKLRSKPMAKLNLYAHDFAFSVDKDYTFHHNRAEENIYWIARDFVTAIARDGESILEESGVPIRDAFRAALQIAQDGKNRTVTLRAFRSMSASEIALLYGDALTHAFRDVMVSDLHQEFETEIVNLLAELLRRPVWSEGATGLVFAGFGDTEMFPTAKAYMIDGVVAGRLRYGYTHKTKISQAVTSAIIPFAQKEMVYRLMEGIDPGYSEYLRNTVISIMTRSMDAVISKYVRGTKARRALIKEDLDKLILSDLGNFFNEAASYRRRKFSDPIISMTQLLPKEELAHLAESLVNLTSLKRRISLDDESVGGPIDVAVISKGDGFVWIKRKHYFDPSLNGSFMANYFRSHVEGEGETGHERHQKQGNA